MAKKYTEIGDLLIGKTKDDGSKGDLYIKIKKDVTLSQNTIVRLEDPKAKYERMINSGKVDVAKMKEQMAKIPDYVKKTLVAVEEV